MSRTVIISLLVALCALSCFAGQSSNFYSNRYSLKVVNCTSQLPVALLQSNTTFYTSLLSSSHGAFTALYPKEDLAIVSTFTAFGVPGLTTMYVTYNVSGTNLREISRQYNPPGVFLAAAGTSSVIPNSDEYFAVSAGMNFSTTVVCGNFSNPACFVTTITYSIIGSVIGSNGVINPTFAINKDISGFDPLMITLIPTFNGAYVLSTDGEFLMTTYSVHNGANPYLVAAQKIGVVKVVHNTSGTFALPKTMITLPSTDKPYTNYYAQMGEMKYIGNGKYVVYTALISFNLLTFELWDLPAATIAHIYDVNANTLTQTGFLPHPSTVQYLSSNPDNTRLSVQLQAFTDGTPSTLQTPDVGDTIEPAPAGPATPESIQAFINKARNSKKINTNGTADSVSNLRAVVVNLDCDGIVCNALTFLNGKEINGAHGWGSAFSPDGAFLVHTYSTNDDALQTTIPRAIPNLAVPDPNVRVPTGSVTTLVSVDKKEHYTLEDWSPSPQRGIVQVFNPAGNKLLVSGQDSPTTHGTCLYEIVEN